MESVSVVRVCLVETALSALSGLRCWAVVGAAELAWQPVLDDPLAALR
ncbi:hypothetical protein AB0D11_01105 [Streptomyces monashensis]